MAKVFNLRVKLLDVTTPVNTDQNGHVLQLIPGMDSSQAYKVHTVVTQSDTGVSSSQNPVTSSVIVEHSPDNVTWMQLFGSVTTNADGTLQDLTGVELMKFVRARTVLTGSAKPSHKVTVSLLSNRAFTAIDKTTNTKVLAQ